MNAALKWGSLLFAAVLVGTGVFTTLGASVATERRTGHAIGDIPHELILDLDVGDVTLVASDGPATVTSSARWGFGRPSVRVSEAAGVLRVSSDCPSGLLAGCSVDWRISVPADVSITVRSDVGDVSVHGFAAQTTVRVDFGDVRIEEARGAVAAQVNVGDVAVDSASSDAPLSAVTDTGDAAVRVPLGSSYDVKATTDVGSTTVDVSTQSGRPVLIVRSDVGDVEATYR